MKNLLTHYYFSCAFIVIIWLLCFIPIPDNPLSHVRLIDKWTHAVLYLVLGLLILTERLRTKKKTKLSNLIYWVWLIPIAMGGIIEVLQATCTGGRRSGEWLDFVADGIGSTLALLIGILLAKYYAKG
ncbi:VanZ family protein [Prevotella sp.]|uniref:VanZ family protein n=1 Tax=Prevotella sp. TaxID=59823 RepID=UPI001CADA8E6|nr:VanZ family protein [Prevotella sp.]MBF1628111.1 VanZ family protein [Prevotella sp.]